MSQNNKPNIVIVGQGAIGLLCYHHLQQAKQHVSLLNATQHTDNARATHYSFTPYQSTEAQSYPLKYSEQLERADIVLFCLKSYRVAQVLGSIAKRISKHSLIILAHNGMGTYQEFHKFLSKEQRVLAMLTTHGCLRTAPFTISHTGLGHSHIGLLSGNMSQLEILALSTLLEEAMPTASFESDIVNKQWQKLAINCVINPITALHNIDNGLINSGRFDEEKKQLLHEIVHIAQREGVILDAELLKETVDKVAEATYQNSSSMRCDIAAKRATEVNYINGFIHNLGIKHNIATPVNTQMWHDILQREKSFS